MRKPGSPERREGHSQAAPWWLVTEPQGPGSPPSSSTCCRGGRTLPSRPPELGRQPPPLGCKGPWGHPGTGLQTAARSGLHPYLHTPTHLCMGTLTCTLTPTFTHAHTSPCRPMCPHTRTPSRASQAHRHPQWHLAPAPLRNGISTSGVHVSDPKPRPSPHGGPPGLPRQVARTPAKPPPDPRPSPPSLCFLS